MIMSFFLIILKPWFSNFKLIIYFISLLSLYYFILSITLASLSLLPLTLYFIPKQANQISLTIRSNDGGFRWWKNEIKAVTFLAKFCVEEN